MAKREAKAWRGRRAGRRLEGLFIAGEIPESGGAVIAPPHPLCGGSLVSPVVSEITRECTKAGLESLASRPTR